VEAKEGDQKGGKNGVGEGNGMGGEKLNEKGCFF